MSDIYKNEGPFSPRKRLQTSTTTKKGRKENHLVWKPHNAGNRHRRRLAEKLSDSSRLSYYPRKVYSSAKERAYLDCQYISQNEF